jgi:hypothetical protein
LVYFIIDWSNFTAYRGNYDASGEKQLLLGISSFGGGGFFFSLLVLSEGVFCTQRRKKKEKEKRKKWTMGLPTVDPQSLPLPRFDNSDAKVCIPSVGSGVMLCD